MQLSEAERLVTHLFKKFGVRWARLFLNEYEGLDIDQVRTEWALELMLFDPETFAYAYGQVKDGQYPPTLNTFAAACRSRPKPVAQQPLLGNTTKPRPEHLDAFRTVKVGVTDYRKWARDLRDWHEAGAVLSPYQIAAYKQALAAPVLQGD